MGKYKRAVTTRSGIQEDRVTGKWKNIIILDISITIWDFSVRNTLVRKLYRCLGVSMLCHLMSGASGRKKFTSNLELKSEIRFFDLPDNSVVFKNLFSYFNQRSSMG